MLVTAQPLRRKRTWIVFGFATLLIVAAAVGISFRVIASNRTGAGGEHTAIPLTPSEPPSEPPISSDASQFLDTLPDYTVSAIRNATSPQSKAFAWVTAEETLLPMWRRTQRFALATLGFSTRADANDAWLNSTGWMNSSVDECSWFGCTCNEEMMIQVLDVNGNFQGGTVPREIGLLGTTTALMLPWFSLTGSIPTEIQFLTNLSVLQIDSNDLSGLVPTEIGLLTNLRLSDLQTT